MKIFVLGILFLFTNVGVQAQHVLVGGPCEGCEAIFEYGNKSLSPVDTLNGFEEATQKLKVTGTIYQSDGETPAEDVIFYIYHTNEEGIYPTHGDETGWEKRHGYIRGWIKTGSDGKYTFYTRKPGSYSRNPSHIHPTVLEPNGKYYYIDMYVFENDPYLSERRRNKQNSRGGSGVVKLKEQNGMLLAKRDIVLGLNVPNYE